MRSGPGRNAEGGKPTEQLARGGRQTLPCPTMGDRGLATRGAVWLATGLGLGLVSPAPGTVGGLWGLPLAWAIGCLPDTAAQALAIALVGLLGVATCSVAARSLGGSKDPQAIVLDEIAALPIAYLGVAEKTTPIWLAGWLLFRLFDIAKPWPIRYLERLGRGWGIMADDWMAAAYACAVLHALLWLDRTLGLAWLLPAA